MLSSEKQIQDPDLLPQDRKMIFTNKTSKKYVLKEGIEPDNSLWLQ